MGGAKTMTAVRQAELMMVYPSGKVVSNIRSWAEKRDRVGYVGDLRGIGMRAKPPNTNDKAEWEWGEPADWVDLGLTTWEELDMDPEEAEGGSAGSSAPSQCEYVKDGGERCGALLYDGHESGMCQAHRHRDDREERRVEQ